MISALVGSVNLIGIGMVVGAAFVARISARDRIARDGSLRAPLNRLYGGFAFWASLPFVAMEAGLLAGQVSDPFQYLAFDPNNYFILAVQALMLAEDFLLILWVFLWLGDYLISLHTEPVHERPKMRLAVRILALALPLVHAWTFY